MYIVFIMYIICTYRIWFNAPVFKEEGPTYFCTLAFWLKQMSGGPLAEANRCQCAACKDWRRLGVLLGSHHQDPYFYKRAGEVLRGGVELFWEYLERSQGIQPVAAGSGSSEEATKAKKEEEPKEKEGEKKESKEPSQPSSAAPKEKKEKKSKSHKKEKKRKAESSLSREPAACSTAAPKKPKPSARREPQVVEVKKESEAADPLPIEDLHVKEPADAPEARGVSKEKELRLRSKSPKRSKRPRSPSRSPTSKRVSESQASKPPSKKQEAPDRPPGQWDNPRPPSYPLPRRQWGPAAKAHSWNWWGGNWSKSKGKERRYRASDISRFGFNPSRKDKRERRKRWCLGQQRPKQEQKLKERQEQLQR